MAATPLERRLYSVGEARRLARRVLPRAVFDFVDGGAEDERHPAPQRGCVRRCDLLPRPLDGTTVARPAPRPCSAARSRMPLIVGPTGLSGLLWPDGELATARAAAAAGTAYCLSHGSTCTIEELAGAGAAPRWMQVFMFRDRGLTRSFTERAQAAGYDALVLTTDNQALGNRERDLRNGFSIPPRLHGQDHARHGGAARLAVADARPARPHLRELHRRRRATSARIAGRMASLLDPGRLLGGRRLAARPVARAAAAQGRAAPRRGAARGGRGHRRHRRQQPWRPPARRRPGLDRGPARDRRRRGRAHPGPARRRRPARRRHRQGPGARRHRLPDRPARISGAWRSPARPASRPCSTSTAARSTGSWRCAAGTISAAINGIALRQRCGSAVVARAAE